MKDLIQPGATDALQIGSGSYAESAGIEAAKLGVHGLRATAATNALDH